MIKIIVRVLAVLLVPLVFAGHRLIPYPTNVGRVSDITEQLPDRLPHRIVTVISDGEERTATYYESSAQVKVGDLVTLREDNEVLMVSDIYRLPSLLSLSLLFVIVVLVVSGLTGIRSLLGLAFSFLVIFKFILPQIVAGSNPIAVTLMASLIILMVSYFLSHGVTTKSVIAILGTFGALVITGLLAYIYGDLAGLTGFGSEEAGFLLDTLPRESFYKLLLAGMIIGSLGVLDDITISQSSIVAELKAANHRLGVGELFARAMRIGHDHIASLVNTLVLVYAGGALPLLLLFVVSDVGYSDLLNYEALAEEIVRTMVASIGLITAVPITTLIASYWYGSQR